MPLSQSFDQFEIPGQVDFITGNGDLPFIKVSNQQAGALVSLLGAQVLSFKPVTETADMLFLSKKSLYQVGKTIRGGIPVCWPWFGSDPAGLHRPNHGFVRNALWSVVSTASTATESLISLQFTDSQQQDKSWKQPFTLTLTIGIGQALCLSLTTQNTGSKPFSVTQAFHTYLNIGNISQAQVLGLENCRYYDKLDHGKEKIQPGIVTITEETDRIYEDVDNFVALHDLALQRRIEITSQHCQSGVVWNPWTKALPDLAPEDYQHFVCVETGNIAFDSIQIPPGGEQCLTTTYKILRD